MNKNKVLRKRRQKLERERKLQEAFKIVFSPMMGKIIYTGTPWFCEKEIK